MNQKKFLELKAKWDEKLRKSGFRDIESNEYYLKDWDSFRFQKLFTPETFEQTKRYWELATQVLHEYDFKDDLERKMWESYIDGKTVKEISESTKRSKTTVFKVLAKVIKTFKL